jgi:hypothetical protein
VHSHPKTQSATKMVAAKQQKAVLVTEIGKPVELGTRDIPTPQAGQVLVKVTATMRTSSECRLSTYADSCSTSPRHVWPGLGAPNRPKASSCPR